MFSELWPLLYKIDYLQFQLDTFWRCKLHPKIFDFKGKLEESFYFIQCCCVLMQNFKSVLLNTMSQMGFACRAIDAIKDYLYPFLDSKFLSNYELD